MMKYTFKVLPLLLGVISFSGNTFSGVDDGDMPLVEASFDSFGGTVQTMIDKKKQSALTQGQPTTEPAEPQAVPEITFNPSAVQGVDVSFPVTFVGMHETADGSRVAEVYYRGNILFYQRGEVLPNKEKIKKIEDRLLTTHDQEYWLSPAPAVNSVTPETVDNLVPAGLIQ